MVVLDDTRLFRAPRKGSGEDSPQTLISGEDSGNDSASGDDTSQALAEFLPKIPESSVVLFTEQPDEKKPGGEKGKASVDKRGRLFKAVGKCGLAVEFSVPDERMLRRWVMGRLGAEKIRITDQTLDTFLAMTGSDMSHISMETEKLISYAGQGGVIRTEDVEALTSEILEGKIFRMLDLIVQHERGAALELYHDLLALKEPPARIFILLMRQFDRLLLVRSILDRGGSVGSVMEESGLIRWQAEKAMRQARGFQTDSLRLIVEMCADLQERAQSGRIDMRLALEMMIIRTSMRGLTASGK
jgi:DNA polymerase-3 subunit delta